MSSDNEYEMSLNAKIKELSSDYSDQKLLLLLKEHGFGHLPFSEATKNLLVKKLARKMLGPDPAPEDSAENVSSPSNPSPQSKTSESRKSDSSGPTDGCTAADSNPNKTHYAVCIPGLVNTITVASDFKQVLKLMKEHKCDNPRMLSFSNLQEATAFSKKTTAVEVCKGANIKSSYPNEKAEVETGEVKLFPSLTPPQLNKFRIHLEKGLLDYAKECIAVNPRYLIGNGDMPTILKEGPRYNALHACVVANQLASCQMVMGTVSDAEYLKRMYGSLPRSQEISHRLVDLYLNTPDKVAKKTPLHIASEKGMVEIVAFLVSFKACVRDYNKRFAVIDVQVKGSNTDETEATCGPTPAETACSRYNKGDVAAVKAQILSLINDGTCYVPLLKSDSLGPYATVAEPFSPSSPYKLVTELEEGWRAQGSQGSAGSTGEVTTPGGLRDLGNLRVRAFAGPMSPREAQDFKRVWRSPQCGRPEVGSPRVNYKVKDGERGFERVGRELAETHLVSWQEYWPFLDAFADLSSEVGLSKLELFFLKQRVLVQVHAILHRCQFTAAPNYSVGGEYVLFHNPDSEGKWAGDSDRDSFHSAESSSDSEGEHAWEEGAGVGEEAGEQRRLTVPQQQLSSSPSSVAPSPPGTLSFLWGGLAKIKNYFSPSKPVQPKSGDGENKENEQFVSSPGTNRNNSKLMERDSSAKDGHSRRDSSSSPDLALSPVSAKTETDLNRGYHTPPVGDAKSSSSSSSSSSLLSGSSLSDDCLPSSQTHDSDIIPPAAHQISSTPKLSEPACDSTKSPSVGGVGEETVGHGETSVKKDPEKSDLWEYRATNSTYSSDGSFSESDLGSPARGHCPNDSLSLVGLESLNSSSASADEKLENSETDGSFNTKLNNFCNKLQKFSIESPQNRDAVDNNESTDGVDVTDSRMIEPCVQLFVGDLFSELKNRLEPQQTYLSCSTDARVRARSVAPRSSLPVVLLRQALDKHVVLADLYVPETTQQVRGANCDFLSRQSTQLVLDEETHRAEIKNVWPGLLTSFPTWTTADRVSGLDRDEVVAVEIVGVPEDKDVFLCNRDFQQEFSALREQFLRGKDDDTDRTEAVRTTVRLVRLSTLPRADVYVCGSVPTKVDADVFHTLNSAALQAMKSDPDRFPLTLEWWDRMDRPGQEALDDLPSPARVRQSVKRDPPPVSPLVRGSLLTTPLRPDSPASSTASLSQHDPIARKLFTS